MQKRLLALLKYGKTLLPNKIMNERNKNILITGVTGFIGRHLIIRLLAEKKFNIYGLTRKHSFSHKKLGPSNFNLFKGDLTNYDSIKDICKNIDIVIHLAAKVGSWGSFKEYYRVNVEGTKNLLKSAEKYKKVKRFVYISTIAVYGNTNTNLIDEEAVCGKIGWPYADTKIEAERNIIKFAKKSKIEITILRAGDVIGLGSIWLTEPIHLIRSKLMILIRKGKGIMNYIWIDDLNNAIISTIDNQKAINQTFNITSGQWINFNHYFKDISRMLKSRIYFSLPFFVVYILTFANEIWFRIKRSHTEMTRDMLKYINLEKIINIDKAKNELEFSPKFNYEDILNKIKKFSYFLTNK